MALEKEDMITPDKKEVVVISLSAMGLVLFLIILLIFVTGIHFLTILRFFADIFSVHIAIIIIGIPILIGLCVYFILTTITIKLEQIGCKLDENSLTLYTVKMIFLVSKDEIPYDRIVKVNMESKNFFSSIFNNKDLVFELNGMNDKELRLPSVKDPEIAASKIIEKINIYRARIQEQIREQDKINNIIDMSRFAYKN